MVNLNINGVDLEFDIFEAENAGKFQRETQKVMLAAQDMKNKKYTDLEKAIRAECKLVFDFIDALFGEGTHKKVFGKSVNLKTCMDAYVQIINACTAEKASLPTFENVPKNRAQRRKKDKDKA